MINKVEIKLVNLCGQLEQIQKAALEYANKSIRDKGIAYLEFIEAAEWADRTLCEQIYNWLKSNLKYNDNNLNTLKQFDMDFLNKN